MFSAICPTCDIGSPMLALVCFFILIFQGSYWLLGTTFCNQLHPGVTQWSYHVRNWSQWGQLPQLSHQWLEQMSVYKINYPLLILDKVEQLIRLTNCELSQTVSTKLKGSFIICSSMSGEDTASTQDLTSSQSCSGVKQVIQD